MILAERNVIAPMTDEDIERVRRVEERAAAMQQVEIETDHVLHAGMYARTITIPPGVLAFGALIKCATLVIISGHGTLYVGDGTVEVEGYHVMPASAGRKQVFLAHEETNVTMLFPSDAQTVAQAEDEFTDESDRLLSRRQSCESITITGEPKCLES